MRQFKLLAVLMSSALLLGACSSAVKLDDESNRAKVEDRSADTRTVSTVTTASADPLSDPQGVLAKRSVYFDLDSYTVKEEYNALVDAHAKFLGKNTSRKIIIQGNTDERGGREYNLALGQKRAEAVRKAMSLLGVSEAQIEAVSFGKEKPKATGSDEAAWSENRRADIVY